MCHVGAQLNHVSATLVNPSLLSASSSPSSPVTRETGKDKHSQLCQVGGEESQNTKCICTCTCAHQAGMKLSHANEAATNAFRRRHSINQPSEEFSFCFPCPAGRVLEHFRTRPRPSISSLLEGWTCKKRIGEISQMGLGEINADATKE